MNNDKTEQPIPADKRLTTVQQIVEWIDREIAEHDEAYPAGKNVFVNGAMTAIKNLRLFIDVHPLPPSPVGEAGEKAIKCSFGLTPNLISTIEAHLSKVVGLGNDLIWEAIGKEIGWHPLTACLYYFQYLQNRLTAEEICSMYTGNRPAAPSRAGEISPAFPRWVKATDREPPSNHTKDLHIRFNAQFAHIFRYFSGFFHRKDINGEWGKNPIDRHSAENIEWLEEAAPTPAPEVKEERKCDCCGTMNRPDDDGIFRECSNCMNEFEPVKDSPIEADGFYCAKPSDIPCHSQCDSCKRVDPRNAPAEQPAHVSDRPDFFCAKIDGKSCYSQCYKCKENAIAPKEEIPEEIMKWIGNKTGEHMDKEFPADMNNLNIPRSMEWIRVHEAYQESAIAMYRKMQDGSLIHELGIQNYKKRQEITTLTQQRDEYRNALYEIKDGKSSLKHTYEEQLTARDMSLVAHRTLALFAEYPSPDTKQQ